MKKIIILSLTLLFMGSCASVVHGTNQKINIKSENRYIKVVDSYGQTVAEGVDNLTVNLKRGKSAFTGASYTVLSGDKKVSIEPKVNIGPFIVGNFFVPTFLGYVVDGLNGAMWDLSVSGNVVNYIHLK